MSIVEAQARTAEIQARLQALAGPPVTPAAALRPMSASGSATAATSGTDPQFAALLEQALNEGSGQAAVPAQRSAGAVGTVAGTATVGGTGASRGADAVIATAKRYLGVPYVWGGTSPAGFDCSGFVQYVYGKHGIDLPRVSRDQARAGRAVSAAEARPGDLVAFDNTSSRAGVDHIGIYLGGGKWIHAPRTGDVVKIADVDLSRAAAIRRVLPDAPVAAARAGGVSAAASGAWAARLPAAGQRYVDAFTAASHATGVDPRLLAAVAWTESGFDPGARSPAGAIGLMQIMPATARGLGVRPEDPAQAAVGAARYLRDQLQQFGGRLDLALAAYNAGPGAVRRYGGIPPYAETQAYVTKVTGRYRQLGGTT